MIQLQAFQGFATVLSYRQLGAGQQHDAARLEKNAS
jgi:hypothetical protein